MFRQAIEMSNREEEDRKKKETAEDTLENSLKNCTAAEA
jgi:hypothetical protein